MAVVTCPSCGALNAAARYCDTCGARLSDSPTVRPCLACGAGNRPAARFCNDCGAGLVPTAATADAPAEPAVADASPPALRLLWWQAPSDSLLHTPSFRALMTMRVATETALSALGYGMLIEVMLRHGPHNGDPGSRWLGLLLALVTISTVAPAALFGPLGGVVVDRVPRRPMLVATNLVRALLCFGFLFFDSSTVFIYLLLAAITAVTQFASPAEAAVLPWVTPADRLAAANSFSNLSESVGQLLGTAILAPVLVKLPGAPKSLILVCGLLLTYAALRAVGVRSPAPPARATAGAEGLGTAIEKPWLVGAREALLEAWRWLAGNPAAFISMMLLVLASVANLIMVTLAPKFTREVIDLPPQFAVFVFGPAVIGILLGLAFVPRMARRLSHRRIVTLGFLIIVAALLLFGALDAVTTVLMGIGPLGVIVRWLTFNHANGRLGTALLLAVPLGFAFAMVQVSAQTLLHERAPLHMHGRVFALQGAVKNAVAVPALLVLGGLTSLVGDVRPVMALAALSILFLALYGASRAEWAAGPRLRPPTPAAEGAAATDQPTASGHGA